MFEPQDHPNDIPAPGAPPTPPYDSAGYTPAMQMGVVFDRLPDATIPQEDLEPVTSFDIKSVGFGQAVLYPLTQNNSYLALNMILAGTGVIYTEPSLAFSGVPLPNIEGPGRKPVFKLSRPRIALWDRYGGSMESGWTRWIMDQFEIPYTVVYASELDAGDLKSKFDVIVFVDGAIPATVGESRPPNAEGIPEKYRYMLKNVDKTTVGKLKEFAEAGGSIITIGSSTNLAKLLGLPVESALVEDGKALPSSKFYVPGSILSVKVDNSLPVAFNSEDHVDVMFDSSPAFKITDPSKVKPIAWYDSDKPLRSGWAWGQKYLKDAVAMAQADVGKGKLYLFGPEILYRGQSQGTFKFFFNALLLSRAEK